MPKVTRIITYDFASQEELDLQLGRSKHDGVTQLPNGKGTIHVATLPSGFSLRQLVRAVRGSSCLWRKP